MTRKIKLNSLKQKAIIWYGDNYDIYTLRKHIYFWRQIIFRFSFLLFFKMYWPFSIHSVIFFKQFFPLSLATSSFSESKLISWSGTKVLYELFTKLSLKIFWILVLSLKCDFILHFMFVKTKQRVNKNARNKHFIFFLKKFNENFSLLTWVYFS